MISILNKKDADIWDKVTELTVKQQFHRWPSFSTKVKGLDSTFPVTVSLVSHAPTLSLAIPSLTRHTKVLSYVMLSDAENHLKTLHFLLRMLLWARN